VEVRNGKLTRRKHSIRAVMIADSRLRFAESTAGRGQDKRGAFESKFIFEDQGLSDEVSFHL
jgi:hypothetical protein